MRLDEKYESVLGPSENHIIGLVYGLSSQRPQTDVFQLNLDSDGNVSGVSLIKSFQNQLKVLIGRGNKMVCDLEVFVKSENSNNWSAYETLDIKTFTCACFIENEDILFGSD